MKLDYENLFLDLAKAVKYKTAADALAVINKYENATEKTINEDGKINGKKAKK